MFSVVAIDSGLRPLIRDYLPLYASCMKQDTIKIIEYHPYNDSIETVFPELSETVCMEKEWRMIIVSDETKKSTTNPFDDKDNPRASSFIKSAQMLGRVPPVVKVSSQPVPEDKKAMRGYDIEIKKYDKIMEESKISEPEQIYLVAITAEKREDKRMKNILREGAIDPEFWNRCNYPANCRFVKYNLLKDSNIITDYAKFELVIALHTLAYNEIPSSSLQAYEIYCLQVMIDRNKAHEAFNLYMNRLVQIKNHLDQMMELIEKNRKTNIEQGSNYSLAVDIHVEQPTEKNTQLMINKKRFGLLKDMPVYDEIEWDQQRNVIDIKFKDYMKQPRRYLKKASKNALANGQYPPNLVSEIYLDEFQYEDLDEEINTIEQKMVACDTYNIMDIDYYRDQLQEESKKVKSIMRKRSKKGLTLGSISIILLVYFIGFIPYFYFAYQRHMLMQALILSLCFCGVMLIVAYGAVLFNMIILQNAIQGFNAKMKSIIKKVKDSNQKYAQYLSYLSSFMKGKSLQYQLEHKDESLDDDERSIRIHLKYIQRCVGRVKKWNDPLLMDFYDLYRPEQFMHFELDKKPDENEIYIFQDESKIYEIQLNEDSEKLDTPYAFIQKIIILKEAEM